MFLHISYTILLRRSDLSAVVVKPPRPPETSHPLGLRARLTAKRSGHHGDAGMILAPAVRNRLAFDHTSLAT